MFGYLVAAAALPKRNLRPSYGATNLEALSTSGPSLCLPLGLRLGFAWASLWRCSSFAGASLGLRWGVAQALLPRRTGAACATPGPDAYTSRTGKTLHAERLPTCAQYLKSVLRVILCSFRLQMRSDPAPLTCRPCAAHVSEADRARSLRFAEVGRLRAHLDELW